MLLTNWVDVKFMWQISGPLGNVADLGNYTSGYLHDTNFNCSINFHFKSKFKGDQFLSKNCQLIVWGPKLQAILRNRGSANLPKLEQFENCSVFYCTKSKKFMKKSQLLYLGLHIVGLFERSGGGGVCQSSQNSPIFQKFEQFLWQNQNSKGVHFIKKIVKLFF